jgi:hypothetical protein
MGPSLRWGDGGTEGASARKRLLRLPIIATLGLLAWFATQILGLGLAGAGHGWVAPFFASMPLIILYPLAVGAVFGGRRSSKTGPGLVAAAMALDLVLAGFTFSEEGRYFVKMARYDPAAMAVWFALWSGWQVLALIALLGGRNSRVGTNPA